MILRRALPLALLVITEPASQLFAQAWRVDFSGSTVRYDTASRFGSAAVSPYIGWSSSRRNFSVNGSLATIGRSQWSVQGTSAASAAIRAPAGFDILVAGDLGGTVHSSEYRTSLLRGETRIVKERVRGGWWTGLTAATGWTSIAGAGATSSWGFTGGAWRQVSAARMGFSISPFRLAGGWYSDMQADIAVAAGQTAVTGFVGWRALPAGSQIPTGPWGGTSLTWRWTSRLAVLVSAGWYPADLLQGLPRGRYAAAGVRLSPSLPLALSQPLPRIYRKRGNMGELAFIVSDAAQVELAAEWNHWERVPLRAVGKRWVLDVALTPGVYRFNLVVDGQRWIVPEGVTEVDDGFGGKTGLLIVPE